MTEEITAALAKVPDLRVVARTSAFAFKGKSVDIKSMGEQLGATHLIEGSVRKAGNRLRITAQLIKSDDGTHIWAEDYDRDLNDVFAIQEDIARSITASLHMTLGLKPGEQLVKQRNIEPELHEQYLRARNLIRTRQVSPTTDAIKLLNQVIGRNPDYAPAWAALAQAYNGLLIVDPDINLGLSDNAKTSVSQLMENVEAAANQAIKLDTDTAEAYCALSTVRGSHRDQIEHGHYASVASHSTLIVQNVCRVCRAPLRPNCVEAKAKPTPGPARGRYHCRTRLQPFRPYQATPMPTSGILAALRRSRLRQESAFCVRVRDSTLPAPEGAAQLDLYRSLQRLAR